MTNKGNLQQCNAHTCYAENLSLFLIICTIVLFVDSLQNPFINVDFNAQHKEEISFPSSTICNGDDDVFFSSGRLYLYAIVCIAWKC